MNDLKFAFRQRPKDLWIGDGWYSNKNRGLRAKAQEVTASTDPEGQPSRSPSAKQARKRWAALIKQVYESDPLCCPRCGAEMRIISFIERHQTEVIEKILRHCGLWEDQPTRGPPMRSQS